MSYFQRVMRILRGRDNMVLVRHHVKYKEIHGVDVVVLMEQSEHKKLHNRLRREGKCNIPVSELKKISDNGSAVFRATRYAKNYIKEKSFSKTVYKKVSVRNTVRYNTKTGAVTIYSRFTGNNVRP